jgi:hypothetical protein
MSDDRVVAGIGDMPHSQAGQVFAGQRHQAGAAGEDVGDFLRRIRRPGVEHGQAGEDIGIEFGGVAVIGGAGVVLEIREGIIAQRFAAAIFEAGLQAGERDRPHPVVYLPAGLAARASSPLLCRSAAAASAARSLASASCLICWARSSSD